MESRGPVELTRALSVPIEDRDVLVIEDLLDTGETLAALLSDLCRRGTCAPTTLDSRMSADSSRGTASITPSDTGRCPIS